MAGSLLGKRGSVCRLAAVFTVSLSYCCRVNSNLDLIVSATDLLKLLNAPVTHPRDHASLSTVAELQEVVAYSMVHCAGVERVFTDSNLFQIIAESAAQLPHVVSYASVYFHPLKAVGFQYCL